jgi:predicted heme/steroid binding protein
LFAGRDASVALAKGELSAGLLDKSPASLSSLESSSLDEWIRKFETKYHIVGHLSQSALEPLESAAAGVDASSSKLKENSSNDSEMRCPVTGQTADEAAASAARKFQHALPRAEQLHSAQLKTFSATDLRSHDGSVKGKEILVALRGFVYDVSAGVDVWGADGEYHQLAGRDITIALAKNIFTSEYCDSSISENELSAAERQSLNVHCNLFAEKYPIVGKLESTIQSSSTRSFTLAQLKDSNCISIFGVVSDVSTSAEIKSRFASVLGHDVTRALATGLFDRDSLNQSFVGLDFDQLARVEAWQQELKQLNCVPIGHIVDWEPVEQMRQAMKPRLFSTNFHALLTDENVNAVAEAIDHDVGLVNSICTRTGLSPLQKAVELGNARLVALLLEHGADRSFRCALYDNETADDMARRFNQPDIMVALGL